MITIKLERKDLIRAARNDATQGTDILRQIYAAEVHRLVRVRYSEGEEFAISNKFLLGDTAEFYAKTEYVGDIKRTVKKYIKDVTGVEL